MKLAIRLAMFAVLLSLSWADAVLADGGHCAYVQQGRSATHEVCEMPVDQATCAALEETEGHSNTEYETGACPTEDLVGTCDKGATKVLYFDGDAAQLEIGCGFQGGTWLNP